MKEPGAWAKILDLVMTSDDPNLFEAARGFLAHPPDAAHLLRVIEAFSREDNPDRKALFAYVLGRCARDEGTHPIVDQILAGNDERLKERMLAGLNVVFLPRGSDFRERTIAQIRYLVQSASDTTLRSAATGALKGDSSAEGVQVLIDRMLHDPEAAVRLKAAQALPVNYFSPPPFLQEQITAYWEVVNGDERDSGVKRWAATQILQQALRNPNLVTDEQMAILKSLSDAK